MFVKMKNEYPYFVREMAGFYGQTPMVLRLVRVKTFSDGQTFKRTRFVREKGGFYGQSRGED